MLRKILELDLGPITESELREVLDLATSDIKINRLYFGKRTSLPKFVEIAELCFRAHQRGKPANRQKGGVKREKEELMDNKSRKYKTTDRVPGFVDAKELGGIIFMHAFAIGVITAIIDDPYHTADERVLEIRGTLSDLKNVWSDGSITDGYRQEKALRANGEPKRLEPLKVYHSSRKASRSILKT